MVVFNEEGQKNYEILICFIHQPFLGYRVVKDELG
jgi:hypothetical protein